MLLDPLVNVIETLKERIQVHGPALRESETRTRMALIDPLLSALGWDTSDPTLVRPEYTAGGGRADYALLGSTGGPVALLEAKKLGEVLVPHRMQMLNYANAEGIEYAGLTDGNRWELYKVFERRSLDDRRVLDLSLTVGAPHYCALQLLLLWHPNMASGQPTTASGPASVSIGIDGSPSHWPESSRVDQANVVEPPPSPDEESGWMPVSLVNPTRGDRPPIAIRFYQREVANVSRWNQVIYETVEWLCKQGRLTSQDCPVEIGNTRNLVNTSPIHRNGVKFQSSQATSTKLFLELNHNAKGCVEKTQFLLEMFGVPVDTVELRFD